MESLIKILKSFSCKSNCTLNEKLNTELTDGKICFNSLDLKQKDIKLLNKIISKRNSITPQKYNYITQV